MTAEKMKRMRFVLWFVSLFILGTFSSCIKEDDGNRETVLILKPVSGSMLGNIEFTDVSGFKYIPSTPLLTNPSSQLAYVHFKYNAKELYPEAKSININLLSQPFYITESITEYYQPDIEDRPQNTLNGCNGVLWGREFLIMTLNLFINADTPEDKIMDELKDLHNFTLFYNPDAQDATGNSLKLQLRYELEDAQTPEDVLRSKYIKPFSDSRYWDISHVIEEYKEDKGEYPTSVEVEYYDAPRISVVGKEWPAKTIEMRF